MATAETVGGVVGGAGLYIPGKVGEAAMAAGEWIQDIPPKSWQREVEEAASGPLFEWSRRPLKTWTVNVVRQLPVLAAMRAGGALLRPVGAAVGAAIAGVGGQVPPLTGTPEEAVTVPAGAVAGAVVGDIAGQVGTMAFSEAHQFFRTGTKLGLDPDLAIKYAQLYGPVSGSIEYAQGAWMLGRPIMGRVTSPAVKKLSASVGARVAKELGGVAWEGVEEWSQNAVANYLLQKAVEDHNERHPGANLKAPALGEGGLRAFLLGAGVAGVIRGGARLAGRVEGPAGIPPARAEGVPVPAAPAPAPVVAPPAPVVPTVAAPIPGEIAPTVPQEGPPEARLAPPPVEVAPEVKAEAPKPPEAVGPVLYHGTGAEFADADIATGRKMVGIHLTTDATAAGEYGKVKSYTLSPAVKILDLSDGADLWAWMGKNGLLDAGDLANTDFRNHVEGGEVFRYDLSPKTSYADAIAQTAKGLGYDVVKLPDTLGGAGDNVAWVVLRDGMLKPQAAPVDAAGQAKQPWEMTARDFYAQSRETRGAAEANKVPTLDVARVRKESGVSNLEGKGDEIRPKLVGGKEARASFTDEEESRIRSAIEAQGFVATREVIRKEGGDQFTILLHDRQGFRAIPGQYPTGPEHVLAIKAAVSRGDPVPPEVLADYPDLAAPPPAAAPKPGAEVPATERAPEAHERAIEATPAEAKAAEGKQPWEMTQAEFNTRLDSMTGPKGQRIPAGVTEEALGRDMDFLDAVKTAEKEAGLSGAGVLARMDRYHSKGFAHGIVIEQAVKRGNPVPASVLRDYAGEPWADTALAMLAPPAAPEPGAEGALPEQAVIETEPLTKKLYPKWRRGTPPTPDEKALFQTQLSKIAKKYGVSTKDLQRAVLRRHIGGEPAPLGEVKRLVPEQGAAAPTFWLPNGEVLKPAANPKDPQPGEVVRRSRPTDRPDLPEHEYLVVRARTPVPTKYLNPGEVKPDWVDAVELTELDPRNAEEPRHVNYDVDNLRAAPPDPPEGFVGSRGSGAFDAWRLGWSDAADGVPSHLRVLSGGMQTAYREGWKAGNVKNVPDTLRMTQERSLVTAPPPPAEAKPAETIAEKRVEAARLTVEAEKAAGERPPMSPTDSAAVSLLVDEVKPTVNRITDAMKRFGVPVTPENVKAVQAAYAKFKAEGLGDVGMREATGIPEIGRVPAPPTGEADVGQYAAPAEEGRLGALELPEIVELATDLSGGKYPRVMEELGKAVGRYDPKTRTIRVRADLGANPAELARVLGHEVGHFVDTLPDNVTTRGNIWGHIATLFKYLKNVYDTGLATNKEIRKELMGLSQTLKPFDPAADKRYTAYRFSSKELYADGFTALLNEPDALREKAPKFWAALFAYIDRKPEVKAAWEGLQARLTEGTEAVLAARQARIRGMFERGEEVQREVAEKQRAETVLSRAWKQLVDAVWDRNEDLYRLEREAKQRGIALPNEKRATFWREELPYVAAEVNSYYRGVHRVLEQVHGAGLTDADLQEYAFTKRVTADRKNLINPLGITREAAEQQLGYLRAQLGDTKWNAILDFAEGWRRLREDRVIRVLKEADMYGPELVAALENNKDYARFSVTKFLAETEGLGSEMVTGHIYRQIGTMEEIADPLAATLAKDAALLYAAKTKMAKQSAVDEIRAVHPDWVRPAETRFNGRITVPAEPPANSGLGLMAFLNKGKVEGYWVAKEMADDFKADPILSRDLMRVWQTTSGVVKDILVRYNPAWLARNPLRDFFSAYQKLPHTAFLWDVWSGSPGLLARVVQSIPDAVRDVFLDLATPDVEVMYRGNMLMAGRLWRGDIPDFPTEVQRTMAAYGIGPKETRTAWKRAMYGVLDFVDKVGQVEERTMKVAGYRHLRGLEARGVRTFAPGEIGHMVRSLTGTPDPYRRGRWAGLTNNILLFSTIKKEALRGHIEAAHTTPAGYWWRMLKTSILPKTVLFVAAAGLLGREWKDFIDAIPEYFKMRDLIIPLWRNEKGEPTFLRLPQDDAAVVFGGLFWKALNFALAQTTGEPTPGIKAGEAVALVGSEMPYSSLHPVIGAVLDVMNYLSGKNPLDEFRNQNAVREQVFVAGGWQSHKEFLEYLWNNVGGRSIYQFAPGRVEQSATLLRQLTAIPVFGPVIGSFVKTGGRGEAERAEVISNQVKTEAAQRALALERLIVDRINAKVNAGEKPTAQDAAKVYLEGRKQGIILPTRSFREFKHTFDRYTARNKDNPKYASVALSPSNEAKARLLLYYERHMDPASFAALRAGLIQEGHVTRDVLVKMAQLRAKATEPQTPVPAELKSRIQARRESRAAQPNP